MGVFLHVQNKSLWVLFYLPNHCTASCYLTSTKWQCQAINEEDVFAIQNERSLYPVGWIHVCLFLTFLNLLFFLSNVGLEDITFKLALTLLFFPSYIQTHPSQSCFMSSVDLHTHYSYQVTNQFMNCPYHCLRKFVSSFYSIFCFSNNKLSCYSITRVI